MAVLYGLLSAVFCIEGVAFAKTHPIKAACV